jgi:ABC-2 type transport system ATP-binding protein
MNHVVQCQETTKRYGDLAAVDHVSFHVEEGEIFGLVGPNGAGKTTLIEMLEGLRIPDDGSIDVLGIDPRRSPKNLQEEIGVQLQTTSIQPKLKVREALSLFASFYERRSLDTNSLLEMLAIQDKANTQFRKLSGGQKQRVAIALALVNDPAILFFDEISTGLDPQARRAMWDLMRSIRDQGRTTFLTTHYMEEAEALCDRVAVIDHGRIIALGAPQELIRRFAPETRIAFRTENGAPSNSQLEALSGVIDVEASDEGFSIRTRDDSVTIQELVRLADADGFRLHDIKTTSPTLDDVFLLLTGREMRE